MFAKVIAFLTFTSAAALLFTHLREDSRAQTLEQEVAGQLNALRAHLFKS